MPYSGARQRRRRWCLKGQYGTTKDGRGESKLTGNEVAEGPCPIVLCDPAEKGEEVVEVVAHVTQRRRELLDELANGGLGLEEGVGVCDGGDLVVDGVLLVAEDLGQDVLCLGRFRRHSLVFLSRLYCEDGPEGRGGMDGLGTKARSGPLCTYIRQWIVKIQTTEHMGGTGPSGALAEP